MTDGRDSSERQRADSILFRLYWGQGSRVPHKLATSPLASRSELKGGKERLNRVPLAERNPRSPGDPEVGSSRRLRAASIGFWML
jgi:hypothetical protein